MPIESAPPLVSPKKINVGSGARYQNGYLNIDVEAKYHPDVVGDFRRMEFSGVEEICARHILEHFSRTESIEVLRQWRSWLAPGGLLLCETPDFSGIVSRFSEDKTWMEQHAYGSQEAEWAYHRSAWHEEKFRDILPGMGFSIESVRQSRTYVVRRENGIKIRHKMPNIIVYARRSE